MTTPSFFQSITPGDELNALDHLQSMLSGNDALAKEPGLAYALAQQKAGNPDAGAINQFLQGLNDEKQIRLAAAAGEKLNLDDTTKSRLNAMGLNYTSVELTPQIVAKNAAAQIQQQQAGKQQNIQGANLFSGGGDHHGGGGFWHHLVHDLGNWVARPIETGAVDTLHGLEFGTNAVVNSLGEAATGDLFSGQLNKDMKEQGYDSNSVWSTLAFLGNGKAMLDLGGLNKKYGEDKVQQAVEFRNDPTAARQKIEGDPTSYVKMPDGTTQLTPQAAQQLQYYDSPEFVGLLKDLGAHGASVGNAIMRNAGVAPGSTGFALGSAGLDLAASLVSDPTMVAGRAFKLYKLSQVGGTGADAEKIAAALDPAAQAAHANAVLAEAMVPGSSDATKALAARAQQAAATVKQGVFTNAMQRRTQNFIDTAHEMADAWSSGDRVKAAALSARISAQYPDWAPMTADVVGKSQVLSHAVSYTKKGEAVTNEVLGQGDGIKNLADMANYIASKGATTRLLGGRAAVESTYMPGAVSHFGLRWLHGNTAEWMSARSAQRAETGAATLVSKAEADPELAQKLLDAKLIEKMAPSAADAANAFTGETIASPNANKAFETALRGDRYRITPAGRGEVAYNLRRWGTTDGVGWSTPTAVAARARLAAQRFSTLLPRNTLIDAMDADGSAEDKLAKMVMLYANRGDANLARAAWHMGDEGQRKAILGGIVDQIGHAAGLGRTETGRNILDTAKTAMESYSSVGDEIVYNGQRLAISPGQVRRYWLLPTFQALKEGSHKFGVWESTMGRPMDSEAASKLMAAWKIGALFKPSTVTRNQLEAWLKVTLDGHLGKALQSKAFLSMKRSELWDRGLDAVGKAQYEDALAGGDVERAKTLSNSTLLSGSVTGRSAFAERAAQLAPFALAGRAYRAMVGKTMSQELLDALDTLGPQELAESMLGYSKRIKESDLGLRNAAKQTHEVTDAGFGVARIKNFVQRARTKGLAGENAGESTSWTMQETANKIGAERYAHALATRVNASPDVFRAAMDYLEHPGYDISHITDQMDKAKGLTAYGNVYWPDGSKEAVDAVTPEQKLLGKQQWAEKLLGDYHYMLTGQDRHYIQPLADYIRENGHAPSADEIHDMLPAGKNRPEAVLAPDIDAIPANGNTKPDGLINALLDVTGAGYEYMVERVLQRTTSSPVFLAHYAQSRLALNEQVDRLMAEGISREAAENTAREIAVRNAWVKTEQMIDDPGQKSQFDVVARNFFPFSRATQAMIRRWGGSLWQDPVKAQKAMLAYEGAVHSGMIYNNAYGEPTFVYPGSGVMNMVLRTLGKFRGFSDLARFPVSASMTGGVLMSVPGADNPLRISAGPMIMVPLREISKLLPGDDRILFDELDSAINGPIGQGATGSAFEPSVVRRFFQNMSTAQRNSVLASAMMGATANLAAAGKLPSQNDPVSQDNFRRQLQAQVRTQLFLRAIFGMIAPASPASPSEGVEGSGSDYQFTIQGVKGLSQEYKSILNEVGGNSARATAIWTALHPDEPVYDMGNVVNEKFLSAYTVPTSQATTARVSLPSTKQALQWMLTNQGFIKQYAKVAAYFLPQAQTGEPFSDAAYRAQLELGLRQRKTPTEFLNDLYVRNAEAQYYPTVQEFDAQIAAARASGDSASESQIRNAKSTWEADFQESHQALKEKLAASGTQAAVALQQLAELRTMVANGDVPGGLGADVASLITSYDNYENYIHANKGGSTSSTTARSAAIQGFDEWAQQNITGTPLQDLYNGVFRELNSNLAKLGGNG